MYIPQEGATVTVTLPGEITRAVVVKVVDDDTLIAELVAVPIAKGTHFFRKGDFVPCRRMWNGLEEIWEAMDERAAIPIAPRAPVAATAPAPTPTGGKFGDMTTLPEVQRETEPEDKPRAVDRRRRA